MEIFNTVDTVNSIYSEWYPVQALLTHHTREAPRVVRFASGPQNAV
jgi:hypothetical protein